MLHDLPTTIDTTRRATLWARENTKLGDTIIQPGRLIRTTGSATDKDYDGPPVPLIIEGRKWRSPNPWEAQVQIHVPDDQPQDNVPVVLLRPTQDLLTGIWYPSEPQGIESVGNNIGVANVTWTRQYGQHAFAASGPRADLTAITFCSGHHTYGDGVNGVATTLASRIFSVGRHGVSLNNDYPTRVLLSVLSNARGRAWYRETAHRAYGLEIDGCTIGGNAGYFSGPAGGPDKPGFRYVNSHSRQADIDAGDITRLTSFEWDSRLNFGGIASYGIEVGNLDFEIPNPHIREGMVTPAVEFDHVHGGSIHNCKIPCLGPFAKLLDCVDVFEHVVGNVGGVFMTRQV